MFDCRFIPARLACTLIAALGLGLHAAPARAADESEYARIIGQAVAEFGQAHWEEARALFLRAHRLSPSARTLRGLGMAEFELRHYTASIAYFRASLESDVRPLTQEMRSQVEQALARARGFVAGLQLSVSPEHAVLRVDGRAVELPSDGTLWLDLGAHTIAVSAPGHAPLERRIEVVGGETKRLDLRLQPAPDTPAAPAGEQAKPTGAPSAGAEDSPDNLPAFFVVGGGAALFGAGLVVGALALGAEDDFRQLCPKGDMLCDTSSRAEQGAARDLALASDILWIGGAAVAGAGVAWLLLQPHEEPGAVQATVVALPHAGALTLRGTF